MYVEADDGRWYAEVRCSLSEGRIGLSLEHRRSPLGESRVILLLGILAFTWGTRREVLPSPTLPQEESSV